MKLLYITYGVLLAYAFHRVMRLYDGYRYVRTKYDNSLGRIEISVKYNRGYRGGQH